MLLNKVTGNPLLVRVLPFAVFAALTVFKDCFGENSQYWIYFLKTAAGAWMLWLVRAYIPEMKWKFSWEAAATGIGVFILWVGLDGFYPPYPQFLMAKSETFNPMKAYGNGSALAMLFIAVRTIGSSLVVPPLEEVFYRSFLYRYLVKADFISVPLQTLRWGSFLATGFIFGIGHYEWLPGILCGFAYQWLAVRKGHLGDAMTAHAITNFLLALWIVTRNAYHFW